MATVGAGGEAEVLTQPIEVAKEFSEWGVTRRMSLMQPKWFRRLDVAVLGTWCGCSVTAKSRPLGEA